MTFLKFSLLCLSMGVAALSPAFAQVVDTPAEEAQVKAYVDLMRKDIRKESQAIVDQAMNLEAEQKSKFWGVYAGYSKEMQGLWDQRIANIKKYAENYQSVTDAVADQLAASALNNEAQQTVIRKKYYGQMKAALGPKIAARFLQVENMLGYVIGLQIHSEIPLMK